MEEQKPGRNINFFKLRELIRSQDLTPLEKCVAVDLILYAGVDKEAFPSENTLGKDFNRTDRQIRNCLTKLKQSGWIKSWAKRGFSKSNLYSINEEIYFRNDYPIRKPVSAHIGSTVPVQSGNEFPPKVSQESNQLNVVQQLFEKTAKRNCEPSDIRRLHNLCEIYTFAWVEDAIKEAANRNLRFLEVGLLANILKDWKTDGKPSEKPKFISCNKDGCENGYIFITGENSVAVCECKEKYDQELDGWKKNWGGLSW